MPLDELTEQIKLQQQIFLDMENLGIPSVCAINGYALGGGFEITLAASFRVASTKAKVGLPEVKLGLLPGFGGTTRLPRMIGADNALEWAAAGDEKNRKMPQSRSGGCGCGTRSIKRGFAEDAEEGYRGRTRLAIQGEKKTGSVEVE